jgi:hypothetical protein
MARPAITPRLRDIDPSALARDIAGRALQHILSQETSLVRVDAIPSLPGAEQAEIYRVVRALAGYARGEHELDAPVQDYLVSLVPLYLSVIGRRGAHHRARRRDSRGRRARCTRAQAYSRTACTHAQHPAARSARRDGSARRSGALSSGGARGRAGRQRPASRRESGLQMAVDALRKPREK